MKKIFSILALLFGLLPGMSLTAYAASVSYVDGNGTLQTVDATELESTTTSWTDGSWYIVPEGGLTISGRIAVSGTVNLILRDGTELTASAGITTTNATLNIYAQSTGTGALTATGANGATNTGGNAGIGGIGVGYNASGGAGGTVNIYGGTVTATGGTGGNNGGGGAGIGGGGLGFLSKEGGAGGTVNIYGGTVTATGGTGGNSGGVGAGIGGGGNGYGSSAGAGGTLTLGVGAKLYNGTDNTGTVLDDNDSESRNYSGSRPKNMFAEVTVAAPATKYDLTLATGSDAHGTVAFTVGGSTATQAEKGDVVTVSVTPNDGYSAKDVTVRAYTSWEAASEILTGGGDNPGLVSDVNVAKQENGTWTFTMPEANVWVTVTYAKNLQDAWIQAIADQTYTGSAIEPTIEVKDGETTLTLNTDYTVAYENNTGTGTATVTVTGTGNYSGTATANFTIVADKSALNTAITEAETYYNSIKDDHAEAAAALKTAIDNAKAMQEKGDATQEEVNNALSALTTAKTTAEGAVLTETKNELNDAISEAQAYYNSISESNPDAAAALLEAINAAKAVKDNADATQAEVEAAIAALASAKTTAEGAVLTETKNELNDDITEAEAYYNSISESNPDAAAALLEAINAAKAVKDNADATQEEVETAEQTLTDALNAAKADVALKRITLVIPAKSYMARIDADKRQIENDVAGVKLFSVNNVTNTEVVLTSELSVIAAEMPYFIYNDNDTEVEVSIVVSSEDADNVDYDSDHFKGTLVDKTFTDEDMQAADHYVLSGGSSFVWVKDAGTLAAGKCWVQLPKSPNNAPALSIVHEGETTGISTVKTTVDTKDAAVYDLQGRRVMQPTKGLFIVNGKKVVIK